MRSLVGGQGPPDCSEYRLLTNWDIDSAKQAALTLQQIYGFASGTEADAIAALSNVKQFTRRIGITYEDMVAILKTRFVNPNLDLIPKLERLGVTFAALDTLKNNNDQKTADANFDNLLKNLTAPPAPVEYNGDIKQWVKDNFDRIMGIITLTDPTLKQGPKEQP